MLASLKKHLVAVVIITAPYLCFFWAVSVSGTAVCIWKRIPEDPDDFHIEIYTFICVHKQTETHVVFSALYFPRSFARCAAIDCLWCNV